MERLVPHAALGLGIVDRDLPSAPAALERAIIDSLIREEMAARRHQEGPELSFRRRHGAQGARLDQQREEALRQVQRLIRVMTFSANERINGLPVRLAQLAQS